MARTKQTARKYEEAQESNAEGEELNTTGTDDVAFAKVLEGVDICPMDLNSSGQNEASELGYSSKLVSNQFRHDCEYNSCQSRWSEFAVVDDDEADLKLRTTTVPIIHRHIYENKHWITTSITIQDQAMRDVLTQVLDKYQDLDMTLENWTFAPPFMPLVHRWDVLKNMYMNSVDEKLKNAAKALLSFLTPIIAPSVLSLAQTRATGKVTFQNVWQIFPPNDLVMTKFYGVEAMCRVLKYKKQPADCRRGTPEGWVIDMEYIDWNGEKSGYSTTSLTIWAFDGYRRVTALPVYPVSFLANPAEKKEAMVERGRKFQALRGFHFLTAYGTKVLLETEKPEQRPVAGKVVIDAYAYYRSCNLVKPKLRPLTGEDDEEDGEQTDDMDELSDTPYETDFTAAEVEIASAARGPTERIEDLTAFTDEQAMLTTPWLKGFDLKSKDWCELRVDDLKEMVWNDEAFEKLVLPGGEKELAWSFVESKSLSKGDGFDDFIPDKGRGLIILMFGPPGVGKTFTAEAVAERSRVPLYSMSAGDLGTQPCDVERALDRALELCRMWNAMLLLDEADVFLGARTQESLARNELVSIFLTKLEYYAGILFLTTNRISSIDHAFQSRVDLFLPYNDLTPAARRQVWVNFIERAGSDKFDIDEASLEKLSHLNLNGREIKNLLKTSQMLSLKTGGKVPVDRLYMLAEKRVQALQMLDGLDG